VIVFDLVSEAPALVLRAQLNVNEADGFSE